MVEKLGESARQGALAGLLEWRFDVAAGSITRMFRFRTFSEAFAFMTRVALMAETADHHPDWSNSYNIVTITLSTHSAGGLTEKDIALARAIDGIFG